MKIVAISDTHTHEDELEIPEGDVLIHCGDFSKFSQMSLVNFCDWVSRLPHRLVLITSGNHERFIERDPDAFKLAVESSRENVKVLLHEPLEWSGIKFFGSPYSPVFHNWAYNVPRGQAMAAKWAEIPADTDVLFVHGPPNGILDQVGDINAGCEELRKRVDEIKPKLCLFGHIHVQGGQQVENNGTLFANVAICDDRYKPAQEIQVFEV